MRKAVKQAKVSNSTNKPKQMTPLQIARYIDDIQQMNWLISTKSKLISIKVPEGLLRVFRAKSDLEKVAYQTQIKALKREWLKE